LNHQSLRAVRAEQPAAAAACPGGDRLTSATAMLERAGAPDFPAIFLALGKWEGDRDQEILRVAADLETGPSNNWLSGLAGNHGESAGLDFLSGRSANVEPFIARVCRNCDGDHFGDPTPS
jgi:hypothetical protein